ncbi:SRPBCC family protein [Plantactinospora sp. B6F1]|uniref:SRPBCC family protein n=1 Tax=Plantactinospora sp. B6F1 TaxID=3158971 RepID=UPI00102AF5CC
MPEVDFDLAIQASVDTVWKTVLDVASYPAYMENVLETRILRDDGQGTRASSWSILLKGAVLEWTEEESIDHDRRRMDFRQIDGDMEHLEGFWHVRPLEDGRVSARLFISFRIGIPLLADMLDPLARKAIHDNSQDMLLGIERRTRQPAGAP